MRRIWFLGLAAALLPIGVMAQAGGMTLEQIAKTRTASGVAISPDGGEIAYVLAVPRLPGIDEDGPARTELHVVSRNGDSRGYVTGKTNVAALQWFPDGRSLAFLSKREGDTFWVNPCLRSAASASLSGCGARRATRVPSGDRL